jgi:hypothetical protein
MSSDRSVLVSNAVTVGNDMTVTSVGGMALSGAIDVTRDLILLSGSDLSISQSITVGDDLSATAVRAITVSHALTAGDVATLSSGSALVFTTSAASLTAALAALATADSAQFDADTVVDVAGSFTLDIDGATFASDVAGADLRMSGIWRAATIAVTTHGGVDVIDLAPQEITGDVTFLLGGKEDHFTLTALNDRSGSFTVDGQGAADEFVVNRNRQAVSYTLTFADSGAVWDGADVLTINGRDEGEDTVLVRRNFVALMNTDAMGNSTNKVERINYGADMNGRIIVNTLGGNDAFYSDDTGTIFTLDGGAGNDFFQIGQLFGSAREVPFVAVSDAFDTVDTTQGFLSYGNSLPMVVYGGLGDDTMNVFSNKALTKLYGESGNDTFVVWPSAIKTRDPVLPLPKGHTYAP